MVVIVFIIVLRFFVLLLGNNDPASNIKQRYFEHTNTRFRAGFKTHNWAQVKRILFWTTFFNDPFWTEAQQAAQKAACAFHCDFTNDRSLVNNSDVIIFHGRDLRTESIQHEGTTVVAPSDLPGRNPSQHWILFLLESPIHTMDLFPFNNVFNLTMTYRTDSDVYTAYGLFLNSPTRTQSNEGKTKLIASMISHCNTDSKRELVLKELQSFVPVDIYGSCGNLTCTMQRNECYEYLGKSYKFYLALENSLCEDYVTEKFFFPFVHNMVPVVYGGGSYADLAPKGSYIDIESFSTIRDLSHYLIFLDNNPSEYLKFFEWKTQFRVLVENQVLVYSWCNLCQQLLLGTLSNNPAKQDLGKWWNFKGEKPVCRSIPARFE